jgi:GH24 family phage-related lysozyme (muramidase)
MPDDNGNITPDDMWGLEIENEADRPTAYDDGRGNITVGVGHALDLNARSDITDLPGAPDF